MNLSLLAAIIIKRYIVDLEVQGQSQRLDSNSILIILSHIVNQTYQCITLLSEKVMLATIDILIVLKELLYRIDFSSKNNYVVEHFILKWITESKQEHLVQYKYVYELSFSILDEWKYTYKSDKHGKQIINLFASHLIPSIPLVLAQYCTFTLNNAFKDSLSLLLSILRILEYLVYQLPEYLAHNTDILMQLLQYIVTIPHELHSSECLAQFQHIKQKYGPVIHFTALILKGILTGCRNKKSKNSQLSKLLMNSNVPIQSMSNFIRWMVTNIATESVQFIPRKTVD